MIPCSGVGSFETMRSADSHMIIINIHLQVTNASVMYLCVTHTRTHTHKAESLLREFQARLNQRSTPRKSSKKKISFTERNPQIEEKPTMEKGDERKLSETQSLPPSGETLAINNFFPPPPSGIESIINVRTNWPCVHLCGLVMHPLKFIQSSLFFVSSAASPSVKIRSNVSSGIMLYLSLSVTHTHTHTHTHTCLLYTSPSPRDATLSRMPSSA